MHCCGSGLFHNTVNILSYNFVWLNTLWPWFGATGVNKAPMRGKNESLLPVWDTCTHAYSVIWIICILIRESHDHPEAAKWKTLTVSLLFRRDVGRDPLSFARITPCHCNTSLLKRSSCVPDETCGSPLVFFLYARLMFIRPPDQHHALLLNQHVFYYPFECPQWTLKVWQLLLKLLSNQNDQILCIFYGVVRKYGT